MDVEQLQFVRTILVKALNVALEPWSEHTQDASDYEAAIAIVDMELDKHD
jgi:hypothetical protein